MGYDVLGSRLNETDTTQYMFNTVDRQSNLWLFKKHDMTSTTFPLEVEHRVFILYYELNVSEASGIVLVTSTTVFLAFASTLVLLSFLCPLFDSLVDNDICSRWLRRRPRTARRSGPKVLLILAKAGTSLASHRSCKNKVVVPIEVKLMLLHVV